MSNRKKKKEMVTRYQYNQAGKLTQVAKLTDDQEFLPTFVREYDKGDHLSWEARYEKGELMYKSIYERDQTGHPLVYTMLDRKKNVIVKETRQYNQYNCMTELVRYKKKGEEIRYRFEYQYYEGGCDRSRTILYDSKGRISNEWTFDCKEEGQELVKKENQTQVCQWEETSDQYLLKVYQTFDEKGRIQKRTSKYTLADTILVENKVYDEKNRITKHTTYQDGKVLTYQSYKKGKPWYKSTYTYENGRKTSFSTSGEVSRCLPEPLNTIKKGSSWKKL